MNLESEIWIDISEYKDYYCVSNFGNVKNKKKDKFLKPSGKRYLQVGLSRNGLVKTKLIHQLVAAAFIGERPEGYEINHKDTDKKNNRVDNLEYVTKLANMKHAKKYGLMLSGIDHPNHIRPETLSRGNMHYSRRNPEKLARGDRSGRTKIPDSEICKIFELRSTGLTLSKIGHIFNVSATQINNILKGIHRNYNRSNV